MSQLKLQQDNRDRILRKVWELIDKHNITSEELKDFKARYISHADQMLQHRRRQQAEKHHQETLIKAREARAAKALERKGGKPDV
jgi:hypothetical protein